MKSQAEEVKQIAAQLLSGMLANPHLYQVYQTESGKLSREQQQELIETAIAMAEALITKAETQIERHFQHSL
ncbi:MAG: hypothetical protein QNJ53_16830 [Pleurocapsa sp. MO_192.B19]|nr:hypothetical protein [Pleurocapsa sp. MO_192.B19]